MKQETIIQLLALIIITSLTLFYNPLTSNTEGKIIFSAIIIVMIFVFIVFDLYKLIEDNKLRIDIFNQKQNISRSGTELAKQIE